MLYFLKYSRRVDAGFFNEHHLSMSWKKDIEKGISMDLKNEQNASAPQQASGAGQDTTPKPAPSTSEGNGQPASSANGKQAPAQTVSAPRQPGAIARAWTDITSQQGWWKRVLLLMIMGIVPFLNFFVAGYLLKWATETTNKAPQGLPRHRFDGKTFVWGFFFTVLSLIIGVAMLVVCLYLNCIVFIGAIIAWFFSVFAAGFTYLAGMRMVARDRFSAAFDLSQAFEIIKRDKWHFFLAVFLPGLATVLLILAVIVIITTIFLSANANNLLNLFSGLSGFGSAYGSYGSSALNSYGHYYSSQPNMVASVLGILAGGGIAATVAIVLVGAIATFGQIWVVRSVAQWVCDVAPEWLQGKDVSFTEKPLHAPSVNNAHSQQPPATPAQK